VDTSEESVYLMLCLLLSYVICIAFNTVFIASAKSTKLWYYLLSGAALVFTYCGSGLLHSLVVCLLCFATIKWMAIRTALAVNIVVPMVYLLYGCYDTQIGSIYTIGWTLPQCVLTLRLIAVTFDVYDGLRNDSLLKKSKDNDKQVLV
jgi:lysophospholipid acyltransferase 5